MPLSANFASRSSTPGFRSAFAKMDIRPSKPTSPGSPSQGSVFSHGADSPDAGNRSPDRTPNGRLISFTPEHLQTLSRRRLQRVAKQRGVKANLKTEFIIQQLSTGGGSQSPAGDDGEAHAADTPHSPGLVDGVGETTPKAGVERMISGGDNTPQQQERTQHMPPQVNSAPPATPGTHYTASFSSSSAARAPHAVAGVKRGRRGEKNTTEAGGEEGNNGDGDSVSPPLDADRGRARRHLDLDAAWSSQQAQTDAGTGTGTQGKESGNPGASLGSNDSTDPDAVDFSKSVWCEQRGGDTYSIGDKCKVCRTARPEEKTITLLAQDDTPFTTTESLLRDTVDEGSPLGRILFGPYNTNISHGSVKLQCAPAVIPVMLELLQRGYLTQDPPMHIREKLEFYGLDVRVSLYTRLLANGTGPLQPSRTVHQGRGTLCSLQHNERFLFHRVNISLHHGENPHVRFIDFREEGEKGWRNFKIDPTDDSYSVAGGEEPVVAVFSTKHTQVRVVTLLEESGPDDEEVVWKYRKREADAGANPECVAVNSRYLAVSTLGTVHVFDVTPGSKERPLSKVRTLSVPAGSLLALHGDKLAHKASLFPREGREMRIVDLPTGEVKTAPSVRQSKLLRDYWAPRGEIDFLAMIPEKPSRYGLALVKSGSKLVAHNVNPPKEGPQMREIQEPCAAYAFDIVGPYGFYVDKDSHALNLYC